ncbi:MAG: hypothetical protein ACFE96_04775 [Candidatus Hermodarchaeota archaeon]
MSFRNNKRFRTEYDRLTEQDYVRVHEENKKHLRELNLPAPNFMGVRIIDTFGENLLIEYKTTFSTELETIERKFYYIRVKDSSTDKHVFLSVPNRIKNCKEAIAWTFGLSLREYDLFFQT